MKRYRAGAIAVIAATLTCASEARAYSVLTHESIIDTVWDASIEKLLVKRFPGATPEELKKAHAYAYGGCILQDMGYYPFGSHFFTDLAHYVRSGDFIVALIDESTDINEYAFALGALAHYAADSNGHRIATNRAVPILYPKLRLKYGDEITYDQDPAAHLKTEFGFDVLQVARGRYAPDSYHSFIGFQVSKPVIERAFLRTYGIELGDVFGSLNLALGTYRRMVGSLIPQMTRVAWDLKKDEIMKETPGVTRRKFMYNLSRASYEKDWGKEYQKPGFGARCMALLFRLIPKVGPLKALSFRTPTPEVEKLFMASFNATVDQYRTLLTDVGEGRLKLANDNFDTGKPVKAGVYPRADDTFAKLVSKLAKRQFAGIPPELRENILAFYVDPNAAMVPKKGTAEWAQLVDQLSRLKEMPLVSASTP